MMESFLASSWQNYLNGFRWSEWQSAARRSSFCDRESRKSPGANCYYLDLNCPIIPTKTHLRSFAKTERSDSTRRRRRRRRRRQPALRANVLSPNDVADEKLGETTPEIPDDLIPLPSCQELESEQKLAWGSFMQKIRAAFDKNDSPNIKSAAGSTAPSVRSATTEDSSTTTSWALTTGRKRRAADKDDDDDDFPDENSGGSKKPEKRTKSESETLPRLACPFWKKDPRKYNIHEHRVCASSAWDSVSRVKEHLYRCHLAPPYCKRCKEGFEDEETLQVHLFARIPCSFKEGKPPDGISGAMKKALKNRKNTSPKQPQSERWKEIYRMLFPGYKVPDPWFGPVRDLIELGDFEEYCRQELPKIVQSHLETEVGKDQTTFDDSSLSQIVKIVQSCHEMALSNYRSQLASPSPNIDPNKTPSFGDICNSAASSRSPELTSASALTESSATSIIAQDLVYEPNFQALQWRATSEALCEPSRTESALSITHCPSMFDLFDPFDPSQGMTEFSVSWEDFPEM